MTFAEEMEIISFLLKGAAWLIFAGIFLTRQKHIQENSEETVELLEYIASKLDKDDARKTLDELENELNADTRH